VFATSVVGADSLDDLYLPNIGARVRGLTMRSAGPHWAINKEVARRPHSWRISRVFIRSAWRLSKILLGTSLIAVAAAVALLGIFMALWEYWEGESRREMRHFSLGSVDSRLFSFLEGITWLPRQIWAGLMLVITPIILGLIFGGESLVGFAVEHFAAISAIAGVLTAGLFAWILQKEWNAEFASSSR
jgi:hypothetical protein